MNNFWYRKKVLITGASGFIGSHVVKELQGLGSLALALTSAKADLLDFKTCLKVLAGQEIVLHFAALDGGAQFKAQREAEILRVNSILTLNILEAARQNRIERLLLLSSADIYRKSRWKIAEEGALVTDSKISASGYQWSKLFLEKAAQKYHQQYKLKIAIARPANVYGPGDNPQKERIIPTFIIKALKGESINIWVNRKQKRSYLYISDLVPALLDLVRLYPQADPINLAGSEAVSYQNLASLIVQLTGSKSKINERLNWVSAEDYNLVLNTSKAQRLIGFRAKISLREGLIKTIAYLRTQY